MIHSPKNRYFTVSKARMTYSLLPIGSLTQWKSETKNHTCPEKVENWLYDHNSLTLKLESLSKTFHVEIKQEVNIKSSEQLSGYFKDEDAILVREVLLYVDNIPVVFAQTEIPLSTLTDEQKKITEIGNTSLGKLLFQDPSMLRGQIEVTSFKANSPLHDFCQSIDQATDKTLWSRRSLFYINNKPLLVSELFLPALGLY